MTKAKRAWKFGKPAKLGRSETHRTPRARVLIVCEGECTEPHYLDAVRRDLGLGNVRIAGRECGSDPESVVRYGIEIFEGDAAIDRIICVVDRDEHATFNSAQQLVRQSKKKGIPIELLVSYPSFEFWYLLHFRYTRKPFIREGQRSPATVLISTLKLDFPFYRKSVCSMWETLRGRFSTAMEHAARAEREAKQDAEPNPSTDMHKLMKILFRLAMRRGEVL